MKVSLVHLPKYLAIVLITIIWGTVFADEKLDELISKEKYKEAAEYAEKQIPASSRNVDIWLKMAQAYQKSGESNEKVLSAYLGAQKANPSDPRIYMELGEYHKGEKNYSEAMKHFQKVYLLERTSQAAEGIAICAYNLKQMDKARDAAESALKLDAELVESRKILYEIYLNEKDYNAAAKQLEFIVKKDPKNLKYWKKLALCYEKTNNPEKLSAVDPKIIELDPKNVPSRQRFIKYSLSKNDQNTAFTLLKELAILTPEDAAVFKNLYQISNAKGNKKDATLYLKNYLALDSTNANAHRELGDLYYDQKDADNALDAYRKALKLDPNIKGIYKQYIDIVLEKKFENEAVKVIEGAIKAGEADTRAYIALGDIYKKLNNCSDAVKMYQEALKTDKKNVEVLSSLGECQAKNGSTKDAIITYEQVILLNPNAAAEYKSLGDLHMSLKETESAMMAYKKYLEKVPSDESVARIVGLNAHENKKYKEAIGYLVMVKDSKLHNVQYLSALGESYFKTGDYQKATEYYSKARSKNPSQNILMTILKPLGESYEKIGKDSEAAETYEAYTKIKGVKDADVSYKQALLREKTDKKTAVTIYQSNTILFPQDFRNFLRLGLIFAEDKTSLNKSASMLSKASALSPKDTIIWKNLGQVYGELKDENRELEAFTKLLALDPQDLEANKRVGTILLKKNQVDQAIKHLEIVAEKSPKDVDVMILLADGYMQTKKPDKAVSQLLKAKDIRPDDVDVWISLVAACEAADLKEKVLSAKAGLAELDKKIVASDKKNVDSRLRLADYYLTKKDIANAYTLYKDLAVLTPKDKKVMKYLYDISLKKGDNKEAVEYLKKYLALDADNANAHKSLGNLQYDQKDFDDALGSYRTALKLDPGIKGFYKQYSDIVIKKGLEDEAVTVLNGAIKAEEADINTYITLGNIYQKKKQYASAIAMYKKASDIEPKNTGILSSLAECQASSGNAGNAIITYEQVVLLNPNSKEEYKALGDLNMKLKKEESAIKAYKQYIEKAPGDGEVAKNIGLYEFEKKQYKDAVKYLEMVKDANLQDVAYLAALGESYYKLENCKKTTELFSKLQTKKPSQGVLKDILKPLGECYEKSGDEIKAAEAYDDYTKLPGVSDKDASYKKAFFREKSDKNTAIAIYSSNIKLFPKDHRNFQRLGIIYSQNNSTLSKSADMLNQAAALSSATPDPSIWKILGEVYGKLKNTDKELSAYKKLLSLEPQNLEANRRVGELLMEKKQVKEAITNLEMVYTMDPKDVKVMLLLADGYEATDRIPKALELLDKAQAIKKDDPDLMLRLYELYKASGKKAEAEKEIKQLIALKKDNKHRTIYAQDLIEQKRYDEARNIVNEVKNSDPMNIDGLMLLGSIQGLQNKFDEAIETYKMISYIDEKYAPAIYERAEIYLKQSNTQRAKQFYEKALESNPKFALAELGLAKVAKSEKNNAEYQKHLNKAKALDPKNEKILEEVNSSKK